MTVVFVVISLCVCCTLIESLDGDGPVVKTEIGSVRGRWTPNAQEYLGVPFAQPPVGSLRYVIKGIKWQSDLCFWTLKLNQKNVYVILSSFSVLIRQ